MSNVDGINIPVTSSGVGKTISDLERIKLQMKNMTTSLEQVKKMLMVAFPVDSAKQFSTAAKSVQREVQQISHFLENMGTKANTTLLKASTAVGIYEKKLTTVNKTLEKNVTVQKNTAAAVKLLFARIHAGVVVNKKLETSTNKVTSAFLKQIGVSARLTNKWDAFRKSISANRLVQQALNKTSTAAVLNNMKLTSSYQNLSKSIAKNTSVTKANKTEQAKLNTTIAKTSKGFAGLIPHVAAVTLSYMAMRRVTRAITGTIGLGVEFEHEMSMVRAITEATTAQFEVLMDVVKKAGETTVFTAKEAAEAMRFLAMAGFAVDESIAALPDVLNLAFIGQLELKRATDISTDVLRAFGLEAEQLGMVVDVFTATITNSNTNIEMLGQSMKFVAPVASKLGYSVQQVSAMLGVMSQSGIKAGMAGRSLRMAMMRMSDAAKSMGMEGANLLDVLRKLASKSYSPDRLVGELKTMFGLRSTPAILALMQNLKLYDEFYEKLENSEGAAKKFTDSLKTVWRAFKELSSVVQSLAIEVFEEYQETLESVLNNATEWFRENKDEVKEWTKYIVESIPQVIGLTVAMWGLGKALAIVTIFREMHVAVTAMNAANALPMFADQVTRGGKALAMAKGFAAKYASQLYLLGGAIAAVIAYKLSEWLAEQWEWWDKNIWGSKKYTESLKEGIKQQRAFLALKTLDKSPEQAFEVFNLKTAKVALNYLKTELSDLREKRDTILDNIQQQEYQLDLIDTDKEKVALKNVEAQILVMAEKAAKVQYLVDNMRSSGGTYENSDYYKGSALAATREREKLEEQTKYNEALRIAKEQYESGEIKLPSYDRKKFLDKLEEDLKTEGAYLLLAARDKEGAKEYIRGMRTNAGRVYDARMKQDEEIASKLKQIKDPMERSKIEANVFTLGTEFTDRMSKVKKYSEEYMLLFNNMRKGQSKILNKSISDQIKAENALVTAVKKAQGSIIDNKAAMQKQETDLNTKQLNDSLAVIKTDTANQIAEAIKRGDSIVDLKEQQQILITNNQRDFELSLAQSREAEITKEAEKHDIIIKNSKASGDQLKILEEDKKSSIDLIDKKFDRIRQERASSIVKFYEQQTIKEENIAQNRADKISAINEKITIKTVETVRDTELKRLSILADAEEQEIAIYEKSALTKIKYALKNNEDISQLRKESIAEVEEQNVALQKIWETSRETEIQAEERIWALKRKSGTSDLEYNAGLRSAKLEIDENYNEKVRALELKKLKFIQSINAAELADHQRKYQKALTYYDKWVKQIAKKALQGLSKDQAMATTMKKAKETWAEHVRNLFNVGRNDEARDLMSKWPEIQRIQLEELSKQQDQYDNDRLVAMKSLYKDLNEVSGNYFDAQIQIIELEKEKYIESLKIKADENGKYTQKQMQLLEALNRWQILKNRELVQEYLIANKGLAGGMVAYLVEMKTAWENYYQEIGQFGYDFLESFGSAFEDSFVKVFTEGVDAAKDVWKDWLDDLLDSFLKMIARLIKELVMSGILELLVSALGSGSGSRSISISGGGSGSGVGMGGVSVGGSSMSWTTIGSMLAKGYELYTGKSLSLNGLIDSLSGSSSSTAVTTTQQGQNWAGDIGSWGKDYAKGLGQTGTMTAAQVAGAEAAYAMNTGYMSGMAVDSAGMVGNMANMGANASTTGMGAGAASGIAAAVVAIIIGGYMVFDNNTKPDASVWVKAQAEMSKLQSHLFDVAITGVGAIGYSESDANKDVNWMSSVLADHFSMYEEIYKNVSYESQRKIKKGLENIPWEELSFTLIKMAQDHVTPKLSISRKNPYWVRPPDANPIFDDLNPTSYSGSLSGTGRGNAATQLHALMGKYFEEYVEEALVNIKKKDVYKLMNDNILGMLSGLDKDLFMNDPEEFFHAFNESMKQMVKAEVVWTDFNHWLDGTTAGMTKAQEATTLATAELEGYAAQMEALGVTLSEAELAAKFKDIYNGMTEGIGNLGAIAKPVTGLDKYLAKINGQFDAYLALLERYGVDLDKITDLEEKRKKKLEEAAEEYMESFWKGIEDTIKGAEGLVTAFEEAVISINNTFAGVYATMAEDKGLDARKIEDIHKYYNDAKKAIQDEIDKIMDGLADSIKEVAELINILETGGDISAVITYFEELFKTFDESGADLTGIISDMKNSFKSVINELKNQANQLYAWSQEFGGFNFERAANQASKLMTLLSDFVRDMSDMDSADMKVALGEIKTSIQEYREAVERAQFGEQDYEIVDYLNDVLDYLDGLETVINTFTLDLESLSQVPMKDLFPSITEDLNAFVGGLKNWYNKLEDANGVFDGLQEMTNALSNQITAWVDSLSNEDISNEDVLSGLAAISDSIDDTITAVQDMRRKQSNAGNTEWVYVLDSYITYLKSLKTAVESFEDRLSDANLSEANRQEISDILTDLGKGDYTSAIAYLQKQLDELIAGGGDSETIQKYKDDIAELQRLQDEFIAIERRQLDAIKRSLGLITDYEYRMGRLTELQDRYGNSLGSLVKNFESWTLEELKAEADRLGITWQEMAEDVAFLVQQEQNLYDIRKAQAELAGKDTGLWEIAERYNLDYDKMDKDFAQKIVNQFLSMTAEEVQAWADNLSVSVTQLVADIMTLANAFDLTADAIESLADDIRENLENLRLQIQDDMGIGGGHAARAASIWNQIEGLGETDPMTEGVLLEMTELLGDWYSEGKAAEDERIAGIREELNERKSVLEEELRLAQNFQNVVESLEDLIKSIKYSTLNVSLPYEKAEEAQQDYDTLLAAAMTGDLEAMQEYSGFVQTHLQQQQEEFKSSDIYQGIYDSVMADIEAVKANAEAQSYDEAILAELESIDAQLENLEPDYSALLAQFEGMAETIETALRRLEAGSLVITFEWDTAGSAEAIEALKQILEFYGWEDDVMISFVATMLENFGGTFAERMELLGFLVDPANGGSWTSTATIMMLASDEFWDENTWTDNLELIGFIFDENGKDWNAEAVLTFLANEGAWDSSTFEEAMTGLRFLRTNAEGGWNSDAVITWINNDGVWNSATPTELMSALNFVLGESGWDSKASWAFLAQLSDEGIPWSQLKQTFIDYGADVETIEKYLKITYLNDSNLTFATWDDFYDAWVAMGMSDSWATKYLQAVYEDSGEEGLKYWTDFIIAFEMGDIDDATAEKVLAAVYNATAGQPDLALWSDFKTAMADANVGEDSTAWKTIEAAYNDSSGAFPTWSALETAMTDAGIATSTMKEIQGRYDSGDMTWSELEDMLAATGTPESVIRDIRSSVVGTVEVELTEMAVWQTQTALLLGIFNNTMLTAKSLGDYQSPGNMMGSWSFDTSSWSSTFAGAGGLWDYTAGDGSGGGGGVAPEFQKVYLYGGNGARIDGNAEGLIRTETFPTNSWAVEIVNQGNHIETSRNYLANISAQQSAYMVYLLHIYNRLHDLRVGGTVATTGGSSSDPTMIAWLKNIYNIQTNTRDWLTNLYNRQYDTRVKLYGGNGARIDGTSNGLIRGEMFPTATWANEIVDQGNNIETSRNYLSNISGYAGYLLHIYNRLHDLRIGGTVSTTGGSKSVYVTGGYLSSAGSVWHTNNYTNTVTAVRGVGGYKEGGISTGSESGHMELLHGTEAVIPMKNMSIPVQFLNGGSTQDGAKSEEELQLLREQNELLKEIASNKERSIELDGKVLGSYVDARADNVRVTANRTKGNETRRLYRV